MSEPTGPLLERFEGRRGGSRWTASATASRAIGKRAGDRLPEELLGAFTGRVRGGVAGSTARARTGLSPTGQRAADSGGIPGTLPRRRVARSPWLFSGAGHPEERAGMRAEALPAVPGYDVLAQLGKGGMGVVYEARHLKLDRIVALKMIQGGGHIGPQELARFQTEAEALARLKHPNIVQVYEVGEHAGQPFFSLEFCSGGSLDKKLNGTPLPPKEAALLVETLARAMRAAPGSGDPPRSEAGQRPADRGRRALKITDFGLARKLDDIGQTHSGAIMGTPPYMAPEQARGDSKAAAAATDVYALGAILYECLTGRPPFKASNPMDTLLLVLTEEAVPPRRLQRPKGAASTWRPSVSSALRKEPGEARYASAEALAEDLARFRRGEPIAARPVGGLERGVKWVCRNPVVSALAAAVLVVLVAGLVVSSYFAFTTAREARAARKAEKECGRPRRSAKRREGCRRPPRGRGRRQGGGPERENPCRDREDACG